jgi:chemotaxis protein methyltransferase CheR
MNKIVPAAAAPSKGTGLAPASFAWLADFLKARSGLILGQDKDYLLESRLTPIARQEGCAVLEALVARLRAAPNGPLAAAVVEAMTTNESFFFRDGKPFEHFKTALPRLCAARSASAPLRIWSAACSTGQEAYSLAMLLTDARPILGSRPVEIVGTDLSLDVLARAKDGVYTQFEVQRGLPVTHLVKHFRKDGANWRISDALRAMVTWRSFNLLDDMATLGRFDVVFCRNVLIYFDQPTKGRVLDSIARLMPADGLLYLGGAETVLGITQKFEPLAGERGAYAPAGGRAALQPPATGGAATAATGVRPVSASAVPPIGFAAASADAGRVEAGRLPPAAPKLASGTFGSRST